MNSKFWPTLFGGVSIAFAIACGGGGDDSTAVVTGSTTTTTASTTWEAVTTDTAGGKVEKHPSNSAVRRISGAFSSDVALDAQYTYLIQGIVYIGNGSNAATITIPAGTTLRGIDSSDGSVKGTLVIRKKAKIMAEGTASSPIIFTSNATSPAPQDWGGVIINGEAPINKTGTVTPEGLPSDDANAYGGSNSTDNSGTMKYVRIEYGGWNITSDNELNGLALHGVGSGTVLEYIQVHRNSDDGIEFFGGTAQAKYLVVTGCEDDSIDWTQGWTGKVQFAVVQQYAGKGDQGIEADNNGSSNDATPRAKPTLTNMTLVGTGLTDTSGKSDIGALLREGTAGKISNTIFVGFNDASLDIDQAATWNNTYSDTAFSTWNGELTVTSTVFSSNTNFKSNSSDTAKDPTGVSVQTFAMTHNSNNQEVTAATSSAASTQTLLTDPHNETDPDFTVKSGVITATPETISGDSYITSAAYIGAFSSTETKASNWMTGWTKKDTGATGSVIDLTNLK